MKLVRIAAKEDIPAGTAFSAAVNSEEIVVFRREGAFHALSNTCHHREGPICEGLVEGGTVTCPYHFSRFDVRSGDVIEPLATSGLKKYEIRVEGDDIMVVVP